MIRSLLQAQYLCQRVAHKRLFHNLSRQQWNAQVCNSAMLNCQTVRLINTTDKKKETHLDVYDPTFVPRPKGPETVKDFADVSSQKNWISYGYDLTDPVNDKHLMKSSMFIFITCGCILALYILCYLPDYKYRDWAIREAFLELDRREKLGLPLIDPNVVDPKNITLPTEEEIGDYEIYI